MDTVQTIKQKFTAKGMRITPQRIAVYQVLSRLKHGCADDIVADLREHYPSISVGTVYNTLDCFIEHGLIGKFNTADNRRYYDITTTPHHHLYCDETHTVKDLADTELDRLVRDYFSQHSLAEFELKEIKIQLIGNFK